MTVPDSLMAGKRGLIMGVANDRSIAFGIARVLGAQGQIEPIPANRHRVSY